MTNHDLAQLTHVSATAETIGTKGDRVPSVTLHLRYLLQRQEHTLELLMEPGQARLVAQALVQIADRSDADFQTQARH